MHVLIVDDDPDVRSSLREALELEGHAVRAVANGKQALEELRTRDKACVILLDLMMPVMDGWEFREVQLRDAELARVPVIVFTADGNAASKAAELTADGFLTKPVRVDQLFQEIARYCPGSGSS